MRCAPLANCEDVDVRVEAEAEHLCFWFVPGQNIYSAWAQYKAIPNVSMTSQVIKLINVCVIENWTNEKAFSFYKMLSMSTWESCTKLAMTSHFISLMTVVIFWECKLRKCGMVWLYRAAIPVGRGHLFLTQGDYYLSPRLQEEGETAVFIYCMLYTVSGVGRLGACHTKPNRDVILSRFHVTSTYLMVESKAPVSWFQILNTSQN